MGVDWLFQNAGAPPPPPLRRPHHRHLRLRLRRRRHRRHRHRHRPSGTSVDHGHVGRATRCTAPQPMIRSMVSAEPISFTARPDQTRSMAAREPTISTAGSVQTCSPAATVRTISSSIPPSTSGIDRITDFVHSDDTIRLENGVFTALQPPRARFSSNAFYAGTAAHDLSDRIIYNPATGAVYV